MAFGLFFLSTRTKRERERKRIMDKSYTTTKKSDLIVNEAKINCLRRALLDANGTESDTYIIGIIAQRIFELQRSPTGSVLLLDEMIEVVVVQCWYRPEEHSTIQWNLIIHQSLLRLWRQHLKKWRRRQQSRAPAFNPSQLGLSDLYREFPLLTAWSRCSFSLCFNRHLVVVFVYLTNKCVYPTRKKREKKRKPRHRERRGRRIMHGKRTETWCWFSLTGTHFLKLTLNSKWNKSFLLSSLLSLLAHHFHWKPPLSSFPSLSRSAHTFRLLLYLSADAFSFPLLSSPIILTFFFFQKKRKPGEITIRFLVRNNQHDVEQKLDCFSFLRPSDEKILFPYRQKHFTMPYHVAWPYTFSDGIRSVRRSLIKIPIERHRGRAQKSKKECL